tara:strand:+ start:2211 stop:2495 length:285 start_codon:yes stop_codon:yes gene_type:complete
MSKDKVTNITDKSPNDFVKEKAENDPNSQLYKHINPITGEEDSVERDVLRVRLAQWMFYIRAEEFRLQNVYQKLQNLVDEIDELRTKEKESNNG